MKIKSVRNCGTTLAYPNGCYEAVIHFAHPQSHPNFGEGWGLGDFGDCKTYKGIEDAGIATSERFTGVIAYFNGVPKLSVDPV